MKPYFYILTVVYILTSILFLLNLKHNNKSLGQQYDKIHYLEQKNALYKTLLYSNYFNSLKLNSVANLPNIIKYKAICRYDDNCCGSCVLQSIALLEETFGDEVGEKILFVTGTNQYKISPRQKKFLTIEKFSDLDQQNLPYLIIPDSNGNFAASIILDPLYYDENIALIKKFKEHKIL
ncbi:hypothetical protein GCM10023149_43540 [Mucilaginibacter gynuensis]|uniref:Uncharacterized protein n=1 Tax=Mucilaginibacter gynuensis TaxID=1302236 RepID=A0ABP8H818_9SPHI